MSPFAIDDAKFKPSADGQQAVSLDLAKPPVKPIPHMEFPMLVYKHPNEPFMTIEHRNTQQELVNTEVVPAEALCKSVANKAELDAAIEDGWVKEPYTQQAPPNPNAHLYGGKKSKKPEKAEKSA